METKRIVSFLVKLIGVRQPSRMIIIRLIIDMVIHNEANTNDFKKKKIKQKEKKFISTFLKKKIRIE